MKLVLSILIILLFTACSTYSEDDIQQFDREIEKYLEKNNKDMEQLESGLYFKVISDSSKHSTIQYNDQVTFYYTGEFLSGEVFQVISERQALTYKVKDLIAGWQEGLMQLHGKGSIELIIPPHLGYGSKKTEKIPPNSILHYTLTVTDVK